MNEIILEGCLPDSLMMNLKALGVFRIVAEQKDATVMANWKQDKFVLHTKLTSDELVEFFLKEYAPTPIVSPWNMDSGFYDSEESLIDEIKQSDTPRLEKYRKVICQVENILKEQIPEYSKIISKEITKEEIKKIKDNIKGEKKLAIQKQIRNKIDSSVISWIDAAYVITSDKAKLGTVLGTGGNDGRFEISKNFMCWIAECIDTQDEDAEYNKEQMQGSLFGSNVELSGMLVGFFFPDGFKAENCGDPGFETYSFGNPWDYILMIEGAMLFAGNVSRRSVPEAAFPFTVKSSVAGYGTAASGEKQRGEIWIPLWENPAKFKEIKHVFNEGRAQIRTRNVNTGSDFARSIVHLGIQNGLSGFQRFGMLERKGQAYHASNLGQIDVRHKPQARLFEEVDSWLNRIRKHSSGQITSLLNIVDDLIIKFCADSEDANRNSHHLQKILITLGKLEKSISLSSKMRSEIDPLQRLSTNWADMCYDDTPEFRLAFALASIGDEKYPIRLNLEQIKKTGNKIEWDPGACETVWGTGSVVRSMIMTLERRCIYAQINKKTKAPIAAILVSKTDAPTKDIAQFLEGTLNYEKINDLIHPLSFISHGYGYKPRYYNERDVWDTPQFIPESYVCIKSNFTSLELDEGRDNKFEPSIIPLLRAGNIFLAKRIAQRRLQIAGISTWGYRNFKHVTDSPQELSDDLIEKLTASLLFPTHKKDIKKMLEHVRIKEDKTI